MEYAIDVIAVDLPAGDENGLNRVIYCPECVLPEEAAAGVPLTGSELKLRIGDYPVMCLICNKQIQ